uniref:Uncharacterized protein n=1 Tax=Cannabis sativa TaxID=3483 RepID=A0A803PYQ5_CANSA
MQIFLGFFALTNEEIHGLWLCTGEFNKIAGAYLVYGHGSNGIIKRLDRALCNEDWRRLFARVDVKILHWLESDHRALMVDIPVQDSEDKCGQVKR